MNFLSYFCENTYLFSFSYVICMKDENKFFLNPLNILNLEGNLIYKEGDQAWSILRLRKEILTEFPQLKEKRSKLCYCINFIKDYDSLIDLVKKMKEEKKPLPLLLWFYKVKNQIE